MNLASAFIAIVAPADDGRPIASVNHFFAVVDAETADAIGRSEWLREVANVDVHSTATPDGGHWTGRYVRGRETYVEFFAPGDLGGEDTPAGSLGLGIGGDRIGVVQRLAGRLHSAGIALPVTLTSRQVDGRAVGWFWTIEMPETVRASEPTTSAWAMEYLPTYFERSGARSEPAEGPNDLVSRERNLDDGYRQRLIRDVQEADLSITAEQYRATVAPLLEAGGFALEARPEGVLAASMGVRLRFRFVPTADVGLDRIVFRLNRPVPARAERIGRSCFVVGPRLATWTFRPVVPGCTAGTMAPPSGRR